MFFTGMGAILIGELLLEYIVNQHKIRSNIKKGTNDPVITVKTSKSNTLYA